MNNSATLKARRQGFGNSASLCDTFQVSRVIVRFLRDKAGKVVGFDYSNPVVRNIKFTRMSDHQ